MGPIYSTPAMVRERGVRKSFPNYHDLAEAWVVEQQHDGKTNTRMFFEGPVIYSYGYHFPIARIVDGADGRKAVLFNETRYSNSTSNHQSKVRRALHRTYHLSLRFSLDTATVKADNAAERNERAVRFYTDEIAELVGKLPRARARKAEYQSNILTLCQQANNYADFFGLEQPFPHSGIYNEGFELALRVRLATSAEAKEAA